MTNKRLALIIVIILGGIVLLVVIFAGAVVGIVLYSIGHSEAAATAKDYLSHNEKLKREIGGVRDFGSFVTGNVNVQNVDGNATIHLKVVGERRAVNVSVDLIYRSSSRWRVTDASYVNDSGETIDLMDKYGPVPTE